MDDLSILDVVFGDTRLDVRGTDSEVLVTAVDESGTQITVRLDGSRTLTLIARLQVLAGVLAAVGRQSVPQCNLCIKHATAAVTDGIGMFFTCPDHKSRVVDTFDPEHVVSIGLTHD